MNFALSRRLSSGLPAAGRPHGALRSFRGTSCRVTVALLLCCASALSFGRTLQLSKQDISPLFGAYQTLMGSQLAIFRLSKATISLNGQCRWSYTILDARPSAAAADYAVELRLSPAQIKAWCPVYGPYLLWRLSSSPLPNVGRPELDVDECPTKQSFERFQRASQNNVVCGGNFWEPVLLNQQPGLDRYPKLNPKQKRVVSLIYGRWEYPAGPNPAWFRIEKRRIVFARGAEVRYRIMDVKLDNERSSYESGHGI